MNNQTPMQFVLQLGSLISLYLSVIFLLVLVFGLINLAFPDSAAGYYALESAGSSVRLGIAMVLVFAPTFFFLTRKVNNIRRQTPSNAYLTLTKWLIYFSLLIGGGALLIDLVVVILTFLEGEITIRFILKALAILVVIGAASYYYLHDAKGYWVRNEKKSIVFGLLAMLITTLTVVYGFTQIETPAVERQASIDQQQINDLQLIQWRIQDYLSSTDRLPESLVTLEGTLPQAPSERTAYEYRVTDEGFALCATFQTESFNDMFPRSFVPQTSEAIIINPDNWLHGIGLVCFERKVQNLESD